MAYRSLIIKNPYQLRIKNDQLQCRNDDREVTLPLEDISIIVIDNQESMISTSLMGQLANHNISVIFTDLKHLPSGIFHPINNHYKQLKVFENQMKIKKPTLSQCWQMIIKQKISNQKFVLEELCKNEFYIEKLGEYLKDVKSADNTNREAISARVYFEGVFGETFIRTRDNDDPINCALNYGYTIILSCMIRILCAYGFNTILGIHHNSYSNNYNLACDLIEPFRPIVDRYVATHLDSLESPLTSQNKKDLVNLLHVPVRINNTNYLSEHAMEEIVLSLVKVYENDDSQYLLCPKLLLEDQNNIENE